MRFTAQPRERACSERTEAAWGRLLSAGAWPPRSSASGTALSLGPVSLGLRGFPSDVCTEWLQEAAGPTPGLDYS